MSANSGSKKGIMQEENWKHPGSKEAPVHCSIIMVTYNSSRHLKRYWQACKVPEGIELIVVDNSSTDDSCELAVAIGAIVLNLDRNMGFSYANNRGLEIARGDFILFVNPDVDVNFSEIQILTEAASSREAIVAPQLLNPDGSLQPNGRGKPSLVNKVLSRLGDKKSIEKYYRFVERGNATRVDWAIGAAIMISMKNAKALSGWDQKFFLYYEDSDLCLRARALGIETHIIGDVAWEHAWGRATSNFGRAWVHEIRSMFRFYLKHPKAFF